MKSIIKIALSLSLFCSAAMAGDLNNGGVTWQEGDEGNICAQNCATDDGNQGAGGFTAAGDLPNGGRAMLAVAIGEYFVGILG